MNTKIEQTIEKVNETHKNWIELYSAIGRSGLSLERAYSSLQNSTIAELNERVLATCALAEGLSSVEDGVVSLLSTRLPTIEACLAQMSKHSSDGAAAFAGYPDAAFADPSGNLQIQVTRSNTGAVVLGLNTHLDTIASQQVLLLDQLLLASRFVGVKGAGVFQKRAKEIQDIGAQISVLLAEAKPQGAQVSKLLETVKSELQEIRADVELAQEQRDTLGALVPDAQAKVTAIEAKLTRVEEITKKADTLSAQVAQFESKFDAFQESLDSKLASHVKLEKSLEDALSKNDEREKEIDRLTEKANSMIQGATTAGLGFGLEETRKAYQSKRRFAAFGFMFAICLIAVSAIPLIAHVLPGLFSSWLVAPAGSVTPSPASVEGASNAFLALFGKVALLFPATWLTQFFSKSYSEFFHLEREYAHKAALATSVEGFKLQAPKFQEEITTAVFSRCSQTPRIEMLRMQRSTQFLGH